VRLQVDWSYKAQLKVRKVVWQCVLKAGAGNCVRWARGCVGPGERLKVVGWCVWAWLPCAGTQSAFVCP